MRNIFRTAAALCLGFVAAQASAQDEATYFKGKTVTIIAGSGSGGGVDLYARLIGRHLS